MKNLFRLFTITLLFACSNNAEDKSKINIEESEKTIRIENKELDSLYQLGVFNGFSATAVDSSGIIFNQGYGFADVQSQKEYDENTLINIASISKVFIGVATMKAAELELIKLDDPINKYLPFDVVNPKYPNIPITIRQLATHTSSIIDAESYLETCYSNQNDIPISEELKGKYELYYKNSSKNWIPLEEYLRKMLTQNGAFSDSTVFADREPGKLREYSNIGAALCALVIENASKQPFHQFTKEHIFTPLNMISTAWFYEDVVEENYSMLYADSLVLPYYRNNSYPDGALITSSNDLSKFLIELIQGYSGNGIILSAKGYSEFFKNQLEERALDGKQNFNVGLFIDKELAYNVIGHAGGDPGTNTMMYFNTETKRGRIFITNTDSEKENSRDVFWGIWNAIGRIQE